MNQSVETIESRKATEEELFYLKLARDEFGASIGRIEETAKFLIGAVGAGLCLFGVAFVRDDCYLAGKSQKQYCRP